MGALLLNSSAPCSWTCSRRARRLVVGVSFVCRTPVEVSDVSRRRPPPDGREVSVELRARCAWSRALRCLVFVGRKPVEVSEVSRVKQPPDGRELSVEVGARCSWRRPLRCFVFVEQCCRSIVPPGAAWVISGSRGPWRACRSIVPPGAAWLLPRSPAPRPAWAWRGCPGSPAPWPAWAWHGLA